MAKVAPLPERRILQSFTAPSGRVLEYAFDGRCAVGDPVLFHFHALGMNGMGMGPPFLSYKMYRKPPLPVTEWALLPFRIVAINRAGYGKSTMGNVKLSDWTYDHFAVDVAALADHLNAPKFAVFGGSSGGPHVIAAAALLKGRVTAALSLSGDANYAPGFPKGKKANEAIADGAPFTYTDGSALCHYGGMCGEGSVCCGCCCALCCPVGTKADLRVEVKPLSFPLADIPDTTAVFLVQGDKDDTTDPNCARFQKAQISHAELTMLPGAGHVQLPPAAFDEVIKKLHAAALKGHIESSAPAEQLIAR